MKCHLVPPAWPGFCLCPVTLGNLLNLLVLHLVKGLIVPYPSVRGAVLTVHPLVWKMHVTVSLLLFHVYIGPLLPKL
jgi:hypothetical protein